MTKSRLALLVGLAIDNFGTGLFLPLPILFATREVGLAVGAAGIAVAAGTVAGFALPPVAGWLTHRRGPRFVVVAALLLQSGGTVAYLLAQDASGVAMGAVLMAAGSQSFFCSVSVLVADMTPEEDAKERPFAIVAMVRSAAFGLGNLAAALLLVAVGDGALRLLVAVDAVTFALAAAILLLFVRVETRTGNDDGHVKVAGPLRVLRNRPYFALTTATCLLGIALDFALVGTPVFIIDVIEGPAWLPGALLACLAVLSSVLGIRIVRALAGLRRTSSLQLAGWLYVMWSGLSVPMIWLPTGWLVPFAFAVWLIMVAANKIFFPVSGALSEALPPKADRAGYMATYQYAFTTAGVVAPALVALFDVSAWLPWTVVATAASGGILILRWLGTEIPERVDRPVRPVPA